MVQALKILVTVLAFVWVFSRVSLQTLWASVTSADPVLLSLGALLWVSGFSFGIFRWRLCMRAFGAQPMLATQRLGRLYLIGHFYNVYVPGGIGGDFIRGVASGEAFHTDARDGRAAGVAVVGTERAIGMVSILLFASTMLSMRPLPGLDGVRSVAILAILGLGVGLLALPHIHRSVDRLPRVVANLVRQLPDLERPADLFLALLISVVIQAAVASAGHCMVTALGAEVTLLESLLCVPLSMAATFVPISVGGAGVREAAFVAMFGFVGVAAEVALAGSLLMYAVQLSMGAIGGFEQIRRPEQLPGQP